MSLLRRMKDISVATLNNRLERSEDPVQLIDSFLNSQREQIGQSEKLYSQVLTHTQALRHQFLTAQQMKQKREQQAETAIRAGEDYIARLALQEKIVQGEKEEQFGELYERNKLTLIELEDRIHLLKTDYNEVLAKRQYYLARLESIKLQQKMNERQHNAAYIASQTFQRLDDRISDMEYESNALRDIRRSTQESFRHAGQSVQHVLEREMDKLKAKLEQEGWGRA